MDHARKIGKTEKSFSWRRSPSPPSSISDKPLIEDEELTEDKRLKNWRKWIADRNRHYRTYNEKTDRDYENLVINTPEKYRQTVETKNLLERAEAVVPKKVNKYRNDLNRKPRPFERIALPELIQQEKGLKFQSDENSQLKRNEYLKTRTKLLSREIKFIEPKEPEIAKLFVKGQRLGQKKSEAPLNPIITVSGTELSECSSEFNLEQGNAIVLRIQDRVIESGQESDDKNFNHFTLIFKSSCSIIAEREIILENRGTCTISCGWRYGSFASTLVPSIPRRSPFFFNKNNDVILPGQKNVLRVWFRSRVPCSATEFWTLITDPKICNAPLIFRFWGCCSSTPAQENNSSLGIDHRSIDQYLSRRIRDNMIHDIIDEILDNIRTTKNASPAYKSLFVESEIFRTKNPSYYYHPSVVQKLRTIYDDATNNDSPAWSLSLDNLRQVLLQLKNPQAKNEALLRFGELCRLCLLPSLYNPAGNSKTCMVYNLLCSFANKFEAESECVRTKCSQEENGSRIWSEAQGDASRSTSISRLSQASLTPRRKSIKLSRTGKSTRTRTTSKISISTRTNGDSLAMIQSTKLNKSDCCLYKQILYVRIRELLRDTIGDICGVVDTVNNLGGREK